MKAYSYKNPTLSVIQPWAYFICSGVKDIENRTRKFNYRGRVLIHASANNKLDHAPLNFIFNKDQLKSLSNYYTEMELCEMIFYHSAIIGSVDIVDCVINNSSIWAEKKMDFNIYNLILKNPILFDNPILNVKGKLGIWEYENEISLLTQKL